MARIGKNVTFDGSRKTISDALLDGIAKLAITGVNWSFVDNNTMNIYGEDVDLTTLKTHANNKGYTFTINGDAPTEATSIPDPTPTADEIASRAFLKTAFDTMKTDEKARLIALWEIAYDAINTTPIPFSANTDLKWLR